MCVRVSHLPTAQLLRVAIKACRDVRLHTEDLQQGDRLLQALTELERHCEQGVDAESIWTALARVQLISPREADGSAVEERVRSLLAQIEVQDVYRSELAALCRKHSEVVGSGPEVVTVVTELQGQMDRCEGVGLRNRCDEWTEAASLMQRLKGGLLVADELRHYTQSRNLAALQVLELLCTCVHIFVHTHTHTHSHSHSCALVLRWRTDVLNRWI